MARKHYTLAYIRRVEGSMTPCPFCGKKPKLIFSDDEGNYKSQDTEEYLDDPWSGLAFSIAHPEKCVIGTDDREPDTYLYMYDTPEDAAKAWNRRYNGNNEQTTKSAEEQETDQEGRP